MTMTEGLTDEVLLLVEQSASGLTLADIYRKSQLAETEQAVAGALHRLTGRTHLVRGTDKVYRTPAQVDADRTAPPRQRKKVAPRKKVAKKKAAAKRAAPSKKDAGPWSPTIHGLPLLTDHLLEDIEQASVDAQVRLDRYLSQLDDPLLDSLIEAANAAQAAAEQARRAAGGVK